MAQDPRIAGPLENLRTQRAELDDKYAELNKELADFEAAKTELRKAVVGIVLELAQVLRELLRMAVKR